MYAIEPHVLLHLAANPGQALVTSNYALVVLDGVLYVIPGEFDNMDENSFNRYIMSLAV